VFEMRGSPLGAMVAASSLMVLGPAIAQTPAPKPVAKPPAAAAKPAPAPSPAPAQAAPAKGALDIKGFRSATFGMTPAQVKTAAARDFGPAAKIEEVTDAAKGAQMIKVKVDHLDPGPGVAQIAYVFGATSKTLAIINVTWTTGAEPTEQERTAIAQAGQQLVAYFRSGPTPVKASQGISAFGTNGLVLYTAMDAKSSGVMVAIDGVEYHGANGDKPIASPPPKGPASLRVGYEFNAIKPDVRSDTTTLKPGSF
jgi:hypothetical protein